MTADQSGIGAVVLQGTGGVWRVRSDAGDEFDASLRGKLKQETGDPLKLAVGDEVVIEEGERGGSWSITGIKPRRSVLARRSPGGAVGERVIVANVDQVIVVFSAAKPEPHPRMLDRFLVIAEANELRALIVINKLDLVDVDATAQKFASYRKAGYDLFLTSIRRDDEELRRLHAAMSGRVSALTGPSGVGKSSLLNTLYPGSQLRVGEISESVNKGRHTTVGARLLPLPDGGYVADTPGLREIGVWALDPQQLDSCFPEMRPHIENCRFQDCSHLNEPGCAVRASVSSGAITAERYDSYERLLAELHEQQPLHRPRKRRGMS